jgi:phospholipase/lecithinase/hemolysin
MKHSCTLIAIVTMLGQVVAPQAYGAALPPIKEAVFFGDSLTDAGTFGGLRFTAASGKTWAQLVAEHYGQSAESNEHVTSYADAFKGIHASPGPGGLNYAEGGARAAHAYSQISDDPEGTPISAEVQLKHFLAQHGSFRPDQIAMVYIGTNDVGYDYDPNNDPALTATLRRGKPPEKATLLAEQIRVQAAADAVVQVVRDILRSGGQRLVVFELPDLGRAPWFRTVASRDFASTLTHAFNQRLSEGLPSDPRILVLKMQSFMQPLFDHPQRYGLKHTAHEDACRKADQDFCDADSLVSPDAGQTYLFAASEHLTVHGNELLASYVLQQITDHSWQ